MVAGDTIPEDAPFTPATAVASGALRAMPPGPTRAVPTGDAAATPPGPASAMALGLACATVGPVKDILSKTGVNLDEIGKYNQILLFIISFNLENDSKVAFDNTSK